MSTTTIGSLLAPASGLPTTGILKPSLGNIYTDLSASAAVNYNPPNALKIIPVSSNNSVYRVDSTGNIFFPSKGIYKVTGFIYGNVTSTTGVVYVRCYSTNVARTYGQMNINTANIGNLTALFGFEVNVTDPTIGIYFDVVSNAATLTGVTFNSGSITQMYNQ